MYHCLIRSPLFPSFFPQHMQLFGIFSWIFFVAEFGWDFHIFLLRSCVFAPYICYYVAFLTSLKYIHIPSRGEGMWSITLFFIDFQMSQTVSRLWLKAIFFPGQFDFSRYGSPPCTGLGFRGNKKKTGQGGGFTPTPQPKTGGQEAPSALIFEKPDLRQP